MNIWLALLLAVLCGACGYCFGSIQGFIVGRRMLRQELLDAVEKDQ